MLYRKSVWSNDRYGCFGVAFTTFMLPVGLVFLALAWYAASIGEKILCGCAGFMLVMTFVASWFGLLVPWEWEFVVEDGVMRWGNVRRPEKQRRVNMDDIQSLYYRSDEDQTLAILRDGRRILLPQQILRCEKDADELIATLRIAYPDKMYFEGGP